MKKNLLKLISVLMIVFVSAMAFVGCGDKVFKGEYQEATAEQLYDLFKNVDFDEMYGDMYNEKERTYNEDWSFGFEYNVESIVISSFEDEKAENISESTTEFASNAKIIVSLKEIEVAEDEEIFIAVLAGKAEREESLKGYSKSTEEFVKNEGLDSEEEVKVVTETEGSSKLTAKTQFDGNYVYVDYNTSSKSKGDLGSNTGDLSAKSKCDITTLGGSKITKEFYEIVQDTPDSMISAFKYANYEDKDLAIEYFEKMLEGLEEEGRKLFIDDSNDEIKIKIEVVDFEDYDDAKEESYKANSTYKKVDFVTEELTTIIVLTADGQFKACKEVTKQTRTFEFEYDDSKSTTTTDSLVEIYAFDGKVKDVKKADSYIEQDVNDFDDEYIAYMY